MLDDFGKRLRAYRKLKRWTQARLAEKVGVSVAIIGGLERGVRSPSNDLVRKLMEVLDVTELELNGRPSDPTGGF